MKRSTSWIIAGVFGLLLCGVAYSALALSRANDEAARAEQQANEVQELARAIQQLSDRPTLAIVSTQDIRQLGGMIEQAAEAADIDRSHIGSIAAQDPRRVGQTPYYRVPTRVGIDDVQLGPLLDLLTRLTANGQTRIEELRFSAPHGEIVGNTWNAEFTLAYLIYDPWN